MLGFLIIDDHPLFREALGNAVRLAHQDAAIFEATTIKAALGILAREHPIDLALLDLSLPDANGFSGFLRLRETHPRLPVAIVSSHEDQQIVREALALGAAGYLPKSTSKGELTQAIEHVLSGSVAVPKNFSIVDASGEADRAQKLRDRLNELTPQQIRVLDLIRQGYQNKQIAAELKLAESTVRAHVTEILRKLKLFSRNKAVIEIAKISSPVSKAHSGTVAVDERPSRRNVPK
jgi:DNA-binding NarL/FixJ family response regulator